MSVWLNYYSTRVQLIRELGIMEIDDQGIWIDRPLSEYIMATAENVPLPPGVPREWLEATEMGPLEGEAGRLPVAPDPPMPPDRSVAP